MVAVKDPRLILSQDLPNTLTTLYTAPTATPGPAKDLQIYHLVLANTHATLDAKVEIVLQKSGGPDTVYEPGLVIGPNGAEPADMVLPIESGDSLKMRDLNNTGSVDVTIGGNEYYDDGA